MRSRFFAGVTEDCAHDTDSAHEGASVYTAASLPGSPPQGRTFVLMVSDMFQAGGFCDLLSWLLTLLISQGFTTLRRLRSGKSFRIVYHRPAPCLFAIYDRVERAPRIFSLPSPAAVLFCASFPIVGEKTLILGFAKRLA
jgi:hypothetical protein